jgi:beta-glucosidase-like glycosyl hydrolase
MRADDEGVALKNSACAKHYFAYSLENCFQQRDNCRFSFNAEVDQDELEDTYLPAFEHAVEVGRVSGLMCSENSINGIPACANHWAMQELARGKWGFDGYITGDCGAVQAAIGPFPNSHNFTTSLGVKVNAHGYNISTGRSPNTNVPWNNMSVPAKPLSSYQAAGIDLICAPHGVPSIWSSAPTADVDAALAHALTLHMRLGVYDPLFASSPQGEWDQLDYSNIGTSANQQLAREAAQQSIVMLKNGGTSGSGRQTLPLKANTVKGMVLLAGPTAEVKSGGYSGLGTRGPYTQSMDALIVPYLAHDSSFQPPKLLATVVKEQGCKDSSCDISDGQTKELIAKAVAAAKVITHTSPSSSHSHLAFILPLTHPPCGEGEHSGGALG